MSLEAFSPRVSLEQSRKQAKELLRRFRAGDREAFDRIRWNHPRFRGLADEEIAGRRFALADAQLVVARLHHFASWARLRTHIETLERGDPEVLRFERAADAIVAGRNDELRALLAEHPELVRQRSTRAHRAPLIHYVAANGVEDYRQVTPPNVLEVARLLLDAGADVNAGSDAYGGGSTVLGLTATSVHPHRAGVQIPLVDLLLERGAALDASIVRSALANGRPEAARALVDRGAAVESLAVAAGVGRLDLVRELVDEAGPAEVDQALIAAAAYGAREVVELLLERGADVAASDGMTALHNACGRAELEIARLLIERGAPLEKENRFGGTVLASTLWFAFHAAAEDPRSRDYAAVVELLVAAGARTDVYPEMPEQVESVRRRRTDSSAEP
jgi:hypothetical protein